MKKRIVSIILSFALLSACFSCVPFANAIEENPSDTNFVSDEHLIQIDNERYQVVSLNKEVVLNFFVNSNEQVGYSVDETKTTETTETVTMGDLGADGKISVSDVVSLRTLIMKGLYTNKQLFIADLNKDQTISVSDVIALRKLIMSGKPASTAEYSAIEENTTAWVKDSVMGVNIDSTNYFANAEIQSASVEEINRTYAHNGNQSEITDNSVAATFTMSKDGYTYYIDARVYNNGVAFRYRFPAANESQERTINNEFTNFSLRTDMNTAWYGVNNTDYESEISSHVPTQASADHIVAPLTAELTNNNGYISIQEAGVSDSYGGTNFVAKGNCTYQVSNTWNQSVENEAYTVIGDVTTGWRLINIADTLDELVNNYNVYNVNEAPDGELFSDTSWIEPGRSTWSWLTDYGASLGTADAMYQYTTDASKLGFEYNVIDDGYTSWNDYQNELATLGTFAESLNVKQLLWGQVSTNNRGFKMTTVSEAESFLDFLKSSHIYGGKIDFWWSEANTDRINKNNTALQESILKMAAERQLIINFHGCNKPAGLDATYPNELTREAIRGFENIGSAQNTAYSTQASWLSKLLFTRYLSGHGDFTPACNTAMQIASLICIDSPLNVIATNPTDILENPAVEMIKSIPTVWNQTKVLSNSKIGQTAVYAKEHTGVWYLGGIVGADTNDVSVSLDEFLGDGTYNMELWTDTPDGNKVQTIQAVTKDDVLDLGQFASGTGFAARFTKLSFSQYGGEILYGNLLSMTAVSENSVIQYTTDGSDPSTSSTALVYSSPLQLTETCKVRAAIVSGDGAGTEVSCNFNMVGNKTINKQVSYSEGSSTVSFTKNFDCNIYYTTDGSEPTAQSTQYTAPFTVTENCTVKAIGIPTDESDTVPLSFFVFVDPTTAVTPDVYLENNYVSSHTDWGSIQMDKNLMGEQISLGGTTSSNGTKYDHGFGMNATGYLVYNIPATATRFVGTVGIDDRTWDANDGSLASSTLTISFDGTEYLTTPVFKRGDAYNIAVDIPEGATQMKLYIGDGGNGITCDNVSMGNAGWVMGNKTQNEITPTIVEKEGFTSVTLTPNFNGAIYYTTNGDDPTTNSTRYTIPLKLVEDCTLKILGVPTDGSDTVTNSIDITVTPFTSTPDSYLGTDYISATTGWSGDPVSVNTNTKGGTISIAGTEYAYGIATNANGEFKYNIPEGADKFMGIVGVDDVVYQNTNDGAKASITCSIYFDDNTAAAYSSTKLTPGDFDMIQIAVPEGAQTIRIVFGDAGDGITCDNASMGNAGWILAK